MSYPQTTYSARPERYRDAAYRRVGRSGLVLPPLSLGLWHNFGDDTPIERQRAILRLAFDHGITHFDLANNYGTPYGSAERNLGRLLREDFQGHRDELVISTKAGWDMWPGPYGQGGSSRKYLLSSLEQSLSRLGLDYVDIFYSHRYDPDTPLEETALALASAVSQGKALYVGVSSYPADKTRQIHGLLAQLNVPLLAQQPPYNLLQRDIEHDGVLDTATELGFGLVVYSPLAQGLLAGRYRDGIPEDSRAGRGSRFLPASDLSGPWVARIDALQRIAAERGQSLAQLALAWVLRDPRIASALVGVSRPEQLLDNLAALRNADFSEEELAAIDRA